MLGTPVVRALALFAWLHVLACNQERMSAPAGPSQPAESPASPQIDAATGLRVAPGLPRVVATCTACHSAKLVAQNRGTRAQWEERLRWMQKNHNLWALPADERAEILDYLSTNYAPEPATAQLRRPPIPAYLLPPPRTDLPAPAR